MIAVKVTLFAKPGRPKRFVNRPKPQNYEKIAEFPTTAATAAGPTSDSTDQGEVGEGGGQTTRKATGEMLGVSERLVAGAASVGRSSAQLADAVAEGLISIQTGLFLKDQTPEEQAIALKRFPAGPGHHHEHRRRGPGEDRRVGDGFDDGG
jgi:hypothetical protein